VPVVRRRARAGGAVLSFVRAALGAPRHAGGFDVPDFLAAGPRDILVPAAGAELARDLLGTPAAPPLPASFGEGTPAWVKALAVAMAVGIVALIAAGVFAVVF
jgi:hypothetical protein